MTSVHVKGLVELRRDFAKMDRRLRTEWDRALRDAAKPVADEAKRIAEEKKLHESGALIRGIRIATGRRGSVVVRSTATRRGFKYPAVYEYGLRGSGESVGPRAFLAPALDARREEVVRRLGDVIDRITGEGFGGGGKL